MSRLVISVFSLIILAVTAVVQAAPKYPEVVLPESVERKVITIWSDGRALDGDIFRPKNLQNQKVPAIVTSHGWGGDKNTAARYAAKFAEAGFIALTFTHSSWGESGGNLLLNGKPELDDQGNATVSIHVVRDLVDPIDWVQNVRSAVDYLEGEPNVDSARIGAWGTSFGGGIMVANAVRDERIAALVTQVGAFPTMAGPKLAYAKKRAIDIARGNLSPIPEGIDGIPGLQGTPHLARFIQYQPLADVASVSVPTLLIAAGDEQLFNNEEHSKKAYDIIHNKASVATEYHVIPGINHYGIYFGGYAKGSDLALKWFQQKL
ncbi:alpha/beta hydrolase [Candidatus Pelagadaptatus aseana]|uniref:alpha/beta hydrolase n=1 Tax=Candidatus Pelagadaptatus aseana TaxID=3120508 RepID=UPI003C6FD5B6